MTCRPLPTTRLPGGWLSARGLASTEAAEPRRRFGANEIVEAPPHGWADLVRDAAKDPMIWFLARRRKAHARTRTDGVPILRLFVDSARHSGRRYARHSKLEPASGIRVQPSMRPGRAGQPAPREVSRCG